MKKITKKIINKLFPNGTAMMLNFYALAFKFGHWKSITSRTSIDGKGNSIPWYTYPAIEYLNSFDFTNCDVFEFGSGNSSLYWSLKAKSVVSIEDNKEWYNLVRKKINTNNSVIYCPEEADYVAALAKQGKKFDIVIIDGNHRLKCTEEAIRTIDSDGIIILDNSDRFIEMECGKLLRSNGYIQMDFSGFGPINGYCWTTSIFLKSQKLFIYNFSGPSPVAGLNN
jgi:hypothetical protein